MAQDIKNKEANELSLDINFAADAGGGLEGADSDSFAIPFLRVLQKISPQCDESDGAYLPGAKGGMLLNTATSELHAEVIFLPCAFQRRFIRWAPRGSEGGFRGEMLPEDVAEMRADGRVQEIEGRLYVADEAGEVSEKRSDRLVDTRSHFGLLETGEQVVLPLSSTQIKKSKQLMSILSSQRIKTANGSVVPPTWMNRIRVTSVLESNDQGSWYGVKFEPVGHINDSDLYEAGKQFHKTISEGKVRASYEKAEETSDKF